MSDSVKMGTIIAFGIVVAVGIYMYFTPYQQCVRAKTESTYEFRQSLGDDWTMAEAERDAKIKCAPNSN